jgi:2-polyprenyl-3-methyl-5-hydroxy-6-metoxy-1,4-benzoquinol methylase
MDIKEEEILGDLVHSHWYYVSKFRVIQSLIKPLSITSILDIGAGSGIFSKKLLDSNHVQTARCLDTGYPFDQKTEVYNNKNIIYVKNIDNIDESLILMIDVLEHIENDKDFLNQYVNRMPKGSYLLISVPAFNFLWSGHDVFLEHKRRYTLPELENLIKKSGLRIIRGRYFFGILFPVIALIRLRNRVLMQKGKLPAKSDMKQLDTFTNKLLTYIHTLESKTLLYINRLAGLSAFCLARKDSD